MKTRGLFLLLCLTFSSFAASANNACADLFKAEKAIVQAPPLVGVTKNASDVVLEIFSKILKAPNNSTVKIFTRDINFDGIGSMLVLTSVHESRLGRNLKFEFYLEDAAIDTRIHSLLTESSSNKIRFKNVDDQTLANRTVVVIESKEGTQALEFEGELNSSHLKDNSTRTSTRVEYNGHAVLKASSFKDVTVAEVANLEQLSTAAYTIDRTTPINMTTADVKAINHKAADLALQLYMLKNRHVPKTAMDSLEIMRVLTN